MNTEIERHEMEGLFERIAAVRDTISLAKSYARSDSASSLLATGIVMLDKLESQLKSLAANCGEDF